MKLHIKLLTLFAIVVSWIITISSLGYGQIVSGQTAPVFSLKEVGGKNYDLGMMKANLMIILYFFDVESRPSIEDLLFLDKLAKRYVDADIKVWGITISSKDKVENFIDQNSIIFPILLDDNAVVSDLYNARFILPTSCILGPQLKVLDFIQGGGKTVEIMLPRLAERQLQRKQVAVAKAISEVVIAKNPNNIEAKMVKGYAELKGGDIDAAEKTFISLSQSTGQGEVLGKEGLASIYAHKGQTEKALKLAEEVEKKAPDRGHVHAVKADILYAKGQKKDAEAEYRKAALKKSPTSFEKSVVFNKLGSLQASEGNFQRARELYDQAVAIDPYNIEATANKGATYEKEGNWDKALSVYRQALSMDGDVDRAIKTMKRANIAFNVPTSMILSEAIDIILVLDMTKSIEELTRIIKSKGEKEGAIINVTSRMGAELKGSNFKITAITEKIQVITSQIVTEWRWEIKPIIPGDHNVYLSLNAYFDVRGRDTPKTIQTFRKTIKIEVTWTKLTKDFFQNNWQWLWTSLFIPITIWLWSKRKKNYDKNNKKKAMFE